MENKQDNKKKYGKFFAMIATSMVAMFLLMYTHSYQVIDHFWFSETRLFMTIIMGGSMIIIMLAYMLNMYNSKSANTAIFGLGAMMIIGAIWLVRSQVTVSDTDYMEGMIPHHSIAILTSDRAVIKDVRVRKLADKIIKAQRKEIMEMQWLIKDIKENGIVETENDRLQRAVPEFKGQLEKETKNIEK
ncbi:protein of unknown function [Bizionia echini]|uniref:DUF305 domain-containing protein n=1 Tax=Bizionia echini TaxID=649333 RepID=A0A1I4Z4J7_9FLAO|nr:DUF305 domain-containing protein [Bizionia echini]SFN45195.1 protein of unknown function [Bizionia echini]